MTISSRTPEGVPNHCPICGKPLRLEPSIPPGDAPCPNCGSLLWFAQAILGDEIAFMVEDAIVPDLQASRKADAVREIVALLSATDAIRHEHEEGIVQAILKREDLGSTGIGKGLAIPHAEHPSMDRLVGAMAISRNGIDFSAVDGQPVHTIFLFVSPTDRPSLYLRALERVSTYLRTQEPLP